MVDAGGRALLRDSTPLVAVYARAPPALHPPLEGEGRSPERQRRRAGWGELRSKRHKKIHPHPTAFAARRRSTSPLQGEVKRACCPLSENQAASATTRLRPSRLAR